MGALGAVLYGVSPGDPPTYAGVALLLIATWLPAQRASTLDPGRVLRE